MKTKGQLLLLLLLVSFSSLYAAKPKINTINYNTNVIYQGLTDKKTPSGEGMLRVFVTRFKSSEIKKQDIIEGVFDDNKVEGSLTFDNGIIFNGSLQIEINNDVIIYHLLKGTLQGNISVYVDEFSEPERLPRIFQIIH